MPRHDHNLRALCDTIPAEVAHRVGYILLATSVSAGLATGLAADILSDLSQGVMLAQLHEGGDGMENLLLAEALAMGVAMAAHVRNDRCLEHPENDTGEACPACLAMLEGFGTPWEALRTLADKLEEHEETTPTTFAEVVSEVVKLERARRHDAVVAEGLADLDAGLDTLLRGR